MNKQSYISLSETSNDSVHIATVVFPKGDMETFRTKLILALGEHFDASVEIPTDLSIDDIFIGKTVDFIAKFPHSDTSSCITICQTWLY